MDNEVLKYDLTIKAGSDYQVDFIYTDDDEVPVDVSGWTVESQIREYTEALNAIAFEGTADENGYHLFMDAETTAALRFKTGVYDVFITDGSGTRSPLIEGHVNIIGGVTR